MGRIYEASQVPLRREVVVKMALPGEHAQLLTVKLLHESWLTGLLEHPNIVPVYQLGRDEQGQPMLVMRRIEGIVWSDLLHERATIPESWGEVSLGLEWHIQRLIEVCNAIDFAHSKGILHRDIKPENVMIGAYGEVYVLDWGIAVSLHERDEGLIPLARDCRELEGTPAYMAPEMASGAGELLCPETDVYLLGAVLHEILVRRAPHWGQTLNELLASIFRPEPFVYPEDVEDELAAICHRAMHQSPEARYPSVKAFRQALQNFLKNRTSQRLSAQAMTRLAHLESLLTSRGETLVEGQTLHEVFGRCHFGFQQALEIWSGNQEARAGLQRLLEKMIDYELNHGSARIAKRLMVDLPESRPALETRLLDKLQAEAREQQEVAQLKEMAFETSLHVGARARSLVAVMLALLWGGGPLLTYLMGWDKTIGHGHFLFVNLLFGVFLALANFLGRKTLLLNREGRRISLILVLFLVTFVVHRLGTMLLGVPFAHTVALESVIFFAYTAVLAVLYSRWMFLAALLFALNFYASILWPKHIFLLMAITNFFSLLIIAYSWLTRYDTTQAR